MSQSENLNRNFFVPIEINEGDNFYNHVIRNHVSQLEELVVFLSLCKIKIMCNDWSPYAILLIVFDVA